MLPVATGLVSISLMLSLLKYLQNATIIESSNAEQSVANNFEKVLSGLLHNKIIQVFIKICLPKFATFNASNA